MEILLLLTGILIGAAIAVLYGRSKTASMTTRYEMLEQQCRQQIAASDDAHKAAITARDKAYAESLAAQERHFRESAEQQQARFDETILRMTEQLRSATGEMLTQRQREFAESSNLSLGQIVNPLRETIDRMKHAMEDSTLRQTALGSEMKANIENMMRQSEAARRSADELTRVFKHGSKVQGDWGETVLDELLTSQGLRRGIHYDTQAVIRDASGSVVRTDEGTLMRPDVILHLDQRRELVIDSKVSLTAFMDYVNSPSDAERDHYLKLHIDSLQKHVRELAAKDYSAYIQPPKVRMDYVIMFVPHSGALWTAINAQPDLWRKAMEQGVFIADEQTLFAALKIVNLTWTQITQVQQHEKVYRLAEEMLDRIGQFQKKYDAVGKALEAAQKAYADGQKKLDPQGQSIMGTAGKLIKLGAKQSSRNPLPGLLDVEDIDPVESE